MQLSYRGSVNRWECDENDHLNVRFYVEKHWQTLIGGLAQCRLHAAEDAEALLAQIQVQHIRFLRESRIASGLSGYSGVVAFSDGLVDVLTELRDSFSDEPVSTCIHRLAGFKDDAELAQLPDHAAPRGLPDEDVPYGKLRVEEAHDHGFRTIGMGVIGAQDCAGNGLLQNHQYMGRFSDSMPHLWAALGARDGNTDAPAFAAEGGAVLEYRLAYHHPLMVGSRYELVSGIRNVGAKIQRFAHLMYDADSGELMVSGETVGVRMDLDARKALTLSEERQQVMRQQLIRSAGISADDHG